MNGRPDAPGRAAVEEATQPSFGWSFDGDVEKMGRADGGGQQGVRARRTGGVIEFPARHAGVEGGDQRDVDEIQGE
jgi:hypothetical protein